MDVGIWPPCEAFYIESMLHCTTTALTAANVVSDALEAGCDYSPSSQRWQESAATVVNGVQIIIAQGAALSRYFWPARAKEPHLSRAARLRAGLSIMATSVLRNRDLRNLIEHFDERLDEFCHTNVTGFVIPTYVGPLPKDGQVPTHLFRAYYSDIGVFEILGQRFYVQPVLDEIKSLHDRLVICAKTGGRVPARE